MSESVAERLQALRTELGLTQSFVASKTGIRRSALSEVENGARRVTSKELEELAALYGTTIDYIVTGAVPEAAPGIEALARSTKGLSEDDVAELVRFADFLRTRRTRT